MSPPKATFPETSPNGRPACDEATEVHQMERNQSINQSSPRLLITPLTKTQRDLQELEYKHKKKHVKVTIGYRDNTK